MFISSSKIQSESKSQRKPGMELTVSKCLSVLQRYNLKANHNTAPFLLSLNLVFISSSKIQSESKSQPQEPVQHHRYECLSVLQRYNLKANHNPEIVVTNPLLVFISSSKIQSESKSQPVRPVVKQPRKCLSVLQRYNLKANHNFV